MALRLALVAVAALVLASPAAAKMKTAKLGPVRAVVTWQSGRVFQAKNVLLRIWRDGRLVTARKLGYPVPQALKARDLDGDGEAEVVADFYTGGAHCCLFSLIYRFTGSDYVPLKHVWGDQGYRIADLGRDGTLELVSADDRFAYVFTSYAGSAFPVEAWRYAAGRMTDVTRSYPAVVRADAGRLWKAYLGERAGDVRGVLAAWMADQYLLGRQAAGWKTMARLNRAGAFEGIGDGGIWAKNGAYLAKLRRFLARNGYAQK